GGAAAAVVLAAGAALVQMTAGYAPDRVARDRIGSDAAAARADALRAADADALLSAELVACFRLAGDDPRRAERLLGATVAAASSVVEIARLADPLLTALPWLVEHGDPRLLPDVAVAARTLAAALRSCRTTVRVNTTSAREAGADEAVLAGLAAAAERMREACRGLDRLADQADARL
ncbi:MAG: cyclodeaminase/cyclohydrolase family protein, partial [Microbacterium sp.]|uniref:cyclodeaminase/cyclohydrolase family protein n=1 Tax=Microbacterium sp. TaxID=51671 RepID=UPI0039E3F5BF